MISDSFITAVSEIGRKTADPRKNPNSYKELFEHLKSEPESRSLLLSLEDNTMEGRPSREQIDNADEPARYGSIIKILYVATYNIENIRGVGREYCTHEDDYDVMEAPYVAFTRPLLDYLILELRSAQKYSSMLTRMDKISTVDINISKEQFSLLIGELRALRESVESSNSFNKSQNSENIEKSRALKECEEKLLEPPENFDRVDTPELKERLVRLFYRLKELIPWFAAQVGHQTISNAARRLADWIQSLLLG